VLLPVLLLLLLLAAEDCDFFWESNTFVVCLCFAYCCMHEVYLPYSVVVVVGVNLLVLLVLRRQHSEIKVADSLLWHVVCILQSLCMGSPSRKSTNNFDDVSSLYARTTLLRQSQ
jgi:hypothetical protein